MTNQETQTLRSISLTHKGKVRDTYEIPKHDDLLLQVATDRLSTHNVVHLSNIPRKGEILAALTVFWTMQNWFPQHHVVAYGIDIYKYLPKGDYPDDLHLRTLVVKKLQMVPIEFIFRKYLMGSLWKTYMCCEDPYEIRLPPGLQLMHQFEIPVFTPTDKSVTDDPCVSSVIGQKYPEEISLLYEVFAQGVQHANILDIEIIDTKFEIGRDEDGHLYIADEFLTPDSSRFTRLKEIKEGCEPSWLDKQVFRNFAERIWDGGVKTPLSFPPKVISEGVNGYLQMFCTLTGMPLEVFQEKHFN